jgi:VanZ family protein
MSTDRLRTYARRVFAVCLVVVMIAALLPPQIIGSPLGWDKANHAVTFAMLAMLGCGSYSDRKVQVLIGLLAYGVLIEVLQSFTDYRSAEVLDVVADAVGIAIGWTFTRLLWRVRLASQMPKDLP